MLKSRLVSVATLAFVTVLASASPALASDAAPNEKPLAITGAKIFTAAKEDVVVNHGVVLIRDGKIEALGPAKSTPIPDGYEVHALGEVWIVPGMIDCHNHTLGNLNDLNDNVYLTNSDLSARGAITPQRLLVHDAVTAGVTAGLVIPGSGSNSGGFGVVCKFRGDTVEEMVIRDPGSLKIAQAGNPERTWLGPQRSFMNWNTRQTLEKGRAYWRKWKDFEEGKGPKPVFDPRWDRFRDLFDRKIPASVHTQMYQVVLKTLTMVHDEFGLSTMIDHGTFDGYKTAPEAARRDRVYVINGPRQFHFERSERKIVGNCAGWYEGGVTDRLGVNTDCIGFGNNVGQEDLAYQMSMAVHFGMNDPIVALRGVTIVPAESLHLQDRIGSLEVGKDADLAVFPGNPIDPRNKCLRTYIDGVLVYDCERDGQQW